MGLHCIRVRLQFLHAFLHSTHAGAVNDFVPAVNMPEVCTQLMITETTNQLIGNVTVTETALLTCLINSRYTSETDLSIDCVISRFINY